MGPTVQKAKAEACQLAIISRNEVSNRRMANPRSPCTGDCFWYVERRKINQYARQLRPGLKSAIQYPAAKPRFASLRTGSRSYRNKDEREVRGEACTLDSNVGDCALKEKAVLWMKFLDSSFVYNGFNTDFEFADASIAKHHIITED